MKLIRFNRGRTGVLADGDTVVIDASDALPSLVPGGDWAALIERWEHDGPRLHELADGEISNEVRAYELSEVALEPPLPSPSVRCFAMGGNFPMHTAQTVDKLEMEVSDSITKAKNEVPPWGFYVIPGTIVGQGATVTPPTGTQKLDYEGEVGVVRAAGGPKGSFPIWGYMAWNDFSIRDAAFGLSKVDHGPLTWSLQKNFTSANACGPWMVVDEPIPAGGLRIRLWVNGQERQDDVTTSMKYEFDEIAAHIDEYLPLGAGDMILSGTPGGTGMEGGPAGPFLSDGDIVEVRITGDGDAGDSGVLRSTIVMP
jgi:2-keto-4-pentenoate hydratase/2-oxohepta-3-ene-1,7-dioic acid hydratase in catechol pathway